ncbi:hypothetical protein I6F36_24155 [Bradyrhizobium sp. BRP19]|uniref:hypothetical protein n=1 Tax=Bradyrhizobium sp. BRP19 TaxID=2793823 RepID=UPI001CD20391|nr:hypothetical protein [Bradyrhizobium sp. BRP19]MCA1549929.1 hypothetical protein [Bradyrhizobium sp. BRP19]
MKKLGKALGVEELFTDHLRSFFIDSFYRYRQSDSVQPDGNERTTLRRYLRRFDSRRAQFPLSPAQTRLVLERADPFAEDGLRSWSEPAALEHARTLGTKLPDAYLACFLPANDLARRLPDDHPLLSDLANARRSRQGKILANDRRAIYLRHQSDLLHRAAEESFLHKDAAALFDLSTGKYWELRCDTARPPAGEAKQWTRRADKPERPQLSDEGRGRLARVAALTWPPRPQWDVFRRGVLRRHGGFLFSLSRQGKINREEAARFLKVDIGKFDRMRLDHEAGVFDHWLQPRLSFAESLKWRTFVREKSSERSEGRSDAAFIRELRQRYGLPISTRLAQEALHTGVPSKIPVERTRIRPSLVVAEIHRLEQISGYQWLPEGIEAQRLKLMQQHGSFVFDLILKQSLLLDDAARLFGISHSRACELLGLHREGDLAMALETPTASQKKERRLLFLRELERRGAELGYSELLRDIRRRLRVFIPNMAIRDYVHSLKRDGKRLPGLPRGRISRTKALVPLDAAERRRLQKIARINWDNVDDVPALRRTLLSSDGAFLMTLIDEGKLRVLDGARLLHLPRALFGEVHKDWKVGLSARHTFPPPSGEEYHRQKEIVCKEARGSLSERLELFIVRLGKDFGVLLPRWSIRKLRARMLKPAA